MFYREGQVIYPFKGVKYQSSTTSSNGGGGGGGNDGSGNGSGPASKKSRTDHHINAEGV